MRRRLGSRPSSAAAYPATFLEMFAMASPLVDTTATVAPRAIMQETMLRMVSVLPVPGGPWTSEMSDPSARRTASLWRLFIP